MRTRGYAWRSRRKVPTKLIGVGSVFAGVVFIVKVVPLGLWPLGVGLWLMWAGLGPLVVGALFIWLGWRIITA